VLHVRLRKGSANTQRGVARFVDELIARVRRAGQGQIIIRADTGFENYKLIAALHNQGIEFSIGAKQSKAIRTLIEQIPESERLPVSGYPAGGEAQIAEIPLKASG
jgi:pyridoxal biosynthesis lyase PdxS